MVMFCGVWFVKIGMLVVVRLLMSVSSRSRYGMICVMCDM